MPNYPVIAILMATRLEAHPFIEKLSLYKYRSDPFEIYQKDHLLLIISGMGKANAAMASTYLHLKYRPVCVLNLGAAGATDPSLYLREIYHINKIIEPDRLVIKLGRAHEHFPHVLDGFPLAILATQDKPVVHSQDRAEVFSFAQLADMEGASVVQTCKRFKTRCYLFKFVSDTWENHSIRANIQQFRDGFCDFFCHSVLKHFNFFFNS